MPDTGPTARPTFGVRIPPCGRLDAVAQVVARAERNGFDVAWIPDSQMLWRDTFMALALAAERTSTITLSPGVTNFRTRHVTVLASAVDSLHELAPGRVAFGVGIGDSSVKLVEAGSSTRAELRESIGTLRALLDGELVGFGERRTRLHCSSGRVPVHLAANGPKTLALGGEIADGVLSLGGIVPEQLRTAREAIEHGLAASGRTWDDVTFTVGSVCRLTDDIEKDARVLKPVILHLASIGATRYFERAGIEVAPPDRIPEVYPDFVHAEDWDEAVEAASKHVTDEMAVKYAETFCLIGTVDEIVARIRETIALGATAFCLRDVMSYEMPHALIEAFADIRARLDAA